MRLIPTPREIHISITSQCNLRCSYCAHFSSASDVKNDLDASEWIRFFEELTSEGVLRVILEGGEPFFRKDIRQIISGIVTNRMRFSILTNATLVDYATADFISKTRRCDLVQFSLDGACAKTHDIVRGKGSFEKTIAGVYAMKEAGLPLTCRVTIHKYNLKELEAIASFLLVELGIPTFSTNSACYQGLCRYNSQSLQLSFAERSEAMHRLAVLYNKYPGRITAMAGPLAELRMWLRMQRDKENGVVSCGETGKFLGCGGIFNTLAVRADGIMVPCILLSHIELGRINKNSFRKIWQAHPELQRLRNMRKLSLEQFEFCKGCEYILYCSGSCPAISYNEIGKEVYPSLETCLRYYLENGGQLPRLSPSEYERLMSFS